MKLSRVLIVFLLLFPAAGVSSLLADDAAPGGLRARSFEVRNKDVEKAASLIRPLLSEDGSYSIQPSKNALVVTDHGDVLERVAEVLSRYDVPPRHFRLELTLVSASRSDRAAEVPEDLRPVAKKLAGVLRFNSFEKLAGITTEGSEGDAVVLGLDPGYYGTFRFGEYDPVSETIRLEEFRLERLENEGQPGAPVLRTSLNLKLGQVVVIGASRQPDSRKALMLVLRAEEE